MRVVSVLVALLFATGAPVTAAESTVWNFNVWGGKRAFTIGIETIKKILEAEAPGSFELRINYGDALGPPKKTRKVAASSPGKLDGRKAILGALGG